MAAKTARDRLRDNAVVIFGVALSLFAFFFFDRPALWLLGIWFCVGALRTLGAGSSSHRALWFNLCVAIAVIGGGALYLSRTPDIHTANSNPDFRTVKHDSLGYAPNSGQKTQRRKYTDDEVIYDVTYTIGDNGLRLEPPYTEGAGRSCVLFFGGSHVFGEGVNDEETLPYRFGLETNGQYRIYNFGYSGYGTHQMLAALETGLVDSKIDCEPKHVIYQGGYFHIPRAAGLSSWDKEGPNYELVDEETVKYMGGFHEEEAPKDMVTRLIALSGLGNLISGLHRPPDGQDYDLVLGMLENARRHVAEFYPEAQFHVLFMDDKRRGPLPFYLFAWSRPPMPDSLKQRGFNVLHLNDALPNYQETPELYRLHTLEGHPSAMAQMLIARYLAEQLGEK